MWSMLPGTLLATAFGSVAYVLAKYVNYPTKKLSTVGDDVSVDRQSIKQKNGDAYRCGMLVNSEEPVERCVQNVRTLYDVFMHGLKMSDDGKCVGYRPGKDQPYHFLTYSQVLQTSRDFGAALVGKLGLKPGNDTHVGIYAKNCPEWIMTALACIHHSIVIVPVYDTLGAEAAAFIVEHTEMRVLVADNVEKVAKLLTDANFTALEHVVLLNEADVAQLIDVNPKVQVHSFQALMKEGHTIQVPITAPRADDNYIICYTSGTTGLPKGVMLTHRNVVADMSALYLLFSKFAPEVISPDQVTISYLPLSHMMEQMSHWTAFMMGGSLGYYSGSILTLTNDMQALRPTMFPVVPRLLNRFYDLIQACVHKSNAVSKAIFRIAYQQKLALLKRGVSTRDTIWDRFVFNDIQAQLGGRVHFMVTGSAPVSAEVLEMCRVAFGATILEAYGQTECTAMATCTWPGENGAGHCGGPATCTLLKLADAPDLNYYAAEGKGEIMVKGPICTKGYFKDPEKTAELFDEEGFVHTGDIGQLLPNGCVKIIDRKKHIFKLAQGEYVAPEKIENVFIRAQCVHQIYVDGNSLERYLVAIVVPDEHFIVKWFHENVQKNGKSYKEIIGTKEVQNFILSQLQKIGKENKLSSIEQVKAIHVTSEMFTVENDLLTPTLKAKRPQLRKKYAEVMANLYAQMKLASA